MTISNPLATFAPGSSGAGAWYANNIAYASAEFITQWANLVDGMLGDVDTAIAAINNAFSTAFASPTYNPDIGEIVWTYTAPSTTIVRGDYASLQPTAPTLPTRGGILTDNQFAALVASGRSNVARTTAGHTFATMYEMSGLGLGKTTAGQTVALRVASQKAAEESARVILELTAKRGEWDRADYLTILAAEMQSYKDKAQVVWDRLKAEEATLAGKIAEFTAQLQSDERRFGWTKGHVDALLEEARVGAEIQVDAMRDSLAHILQAQEAIVGAKVGLAQALLSAADTTLGFTGSQDINTSGNP